MLPIGTSASGHYGPFEVLHEAASGGMATVYKARHVRSGKLVALKVLGDGADPERFEREAHVLSTLSHPSIVRYVAHGVTESGQPWLAMEWLDGQDLEGRLEHGTPSLDETLAIGRTVAAVLGYAHRRGLVHRDLKPANVFLVGGDAYDARVLDFGIARFTGRSGITKTGTIIGTVQYMAPEQAIDVRTVDARTDVFALGAVLYHCVTNRSPYSGSSIHEVISQVVRAKVAPLSECVPHVSAELSSLVERMMARKPGDRPAHGDEALAELSRIDPGCYFDDQTVTRIWARPSSEG